MACFNANDVYQLLKASDRIGLCLDYATRPSLYLTRWQELEPSMEFRLFIKSGAIIGINHLLKTLCFIST